MHRTIGRILRAADARGLRCLLIGGNALILLGYIRNTIDVDLLVESEKRSAWLDVMRELGYGLFHGTSVFAQFGAGVNNEPPVDLMFVDGTTWQKMWAGARQGSAGLFTVWMPMPEHMVALKLHAANSPSRGKPDSDWEDIRQVMRICHLSLEEPEFRAMVLRYGGQKAIERIESFQK